MSDLRPMDYDEDVICYLCSEKEGPRARDTNRLITANVNRKICVNLKPEKQPEEQAATTKTSTPSPSDPGREATAEPESLKGVGDSYLVLRFSQYPRCRDGLLVGRAPEADVSLDDTFGLSRHHFALNFDDKGELMVQDLSKTVGTRLLYHSSEQPNDFLRKGVISWSARPPRTKLADPHAIIELGGLIQFKVVVPDHDMNSRTYRRNVQCFRDRAAAAVGNPIEGLQIDSKDDTEAPSGQDTPSGLKSDRTWFKRPLGHGGCGTVSYVWDVTTREAFALKEPEVDRSDILRDEIENLKKTRHKHVVELKYYEETPRPQIFMEYMEDGSLDSKLDKISAIQREQVAVQLFDGIEFLHGKLSMAHRDIKPQNVLVKKWSDDLVWVKIADFGLSRVSVDFKTALGTQAYMAPEIFEVKDGNRQSYTVLVDIWSLGVLLAEIHSLPLKSYARHFRDPRWCEMVIGHVRRLQRRPDSFLSLILDDMLVIDPRGRRSAKECLAKAKRLFGETPIPDLVDDDEDDRGGPTPRASSPDSSLGGTVTRRDTVNPGPSASKTRGQRSDGGGGRSDSTVIQDWNTEDLDSFNAGYNATSSLHSRDHDQNAVVESEAIQPQKRMRSRQGTSSSNARVGSSVKGRDFGGKGKRQKLG